ncbi:sugar ABC transporter substrate-binding protein [Aeromicrobium ginsengisoli]|nr:sugar ABC transporter substrate-binding protein [Aeromicrobium ginsengisoli]
MDFAHTRRRRIGARRRMAALAVAAVATSTTLAACGSSDSGGEAAKGGSAKGKTVMLLAGANSNTWAGYFNKIFTQEMKAEGVTVKPMLTLSPTEQVQQFREAIAQKPDAIVITLLDNKATILGIKQAKQAGVPVITFDGPPDPSVRDQVRSVESDNPALGRLAAENLIEGLRAQGKKKANIIAIGGLKAMLLTQQRQEAFDEEMKKAPEYRVLETTDSQWNPTLALQQAQQLIAKHGKGNIDAAYGMSDYLAIPIIQAAKQAGMKVGGKDGLLVVSGNCFKAGIDAIKKGEMYGTNTEDPGTLAKETADYTTKFLTGDDVEQHVTIKEERINPDNVDQFAEQCSHA